MIETIKYWLGYGPYRGPRRRIESIVDAVYRRADLEPYPIRWDAEDEEQTQLADWRTRREVA